MTPDGKLILHDGGLDVLADVKPNLSVNKIQEIVDIRTAQEISFLSGQSIEAVLRAMNSTVLSLNLLTVSRITRKLLESQDRLDIQEEMCFLLRVN
ncbi:hypothetical protein A3D00_03930 [Candidatus Woesebacteria bacterium RIFCSPHIGHO2_02_FULL_38_9]|uniref:Uncharacterized protein n=1 Tax=Candidatus Woesebacteria bacterium RIFCSPHIGHO2_01_FULL_39_28 TaxID=1802496 RepID=A0A1F7YKX7_9BACT|nr:MAG: hypothetical protein A2627_03245 [Candidatus Woesebacteria bacterium RIFCSPHIGHO2_01_FULL_39_28]OGM31815.1 MAG: hypothetical protein A3D00_03930 [Candidatus Woesebacteria bacterium RIFCSPHIGHO2_02_FULL_38_9]OGM56946.1 MAG: hypothetical protein A3A50_03590 [Candidatus Woesebacteria bacterium RIFCSPLOWO2_01_FULL_38_20]